MFVHIPTKHHPILFSTQISLGALIVNKQIQVLVLYLDKVLRFQEECPHGK